MSISLKDVQSKKKNTEKKNHTSIKTKSLRPWESFDQQEDQIRTISAKEAVSKAKNRNDNFSLKIEKTEILDRSQSLVAKVRINTNNKSINLFRFIWKLYLLAFK